MKLYLVHCGFYDNSICDGLYESHANYFISAQSFDDAKLKIRSIDEFKAKKMHIDGLQEISVVDGYQVKLSYDAALENQTIITNFKHRDLAPKAP